jgi:type IV pilus assembly protein PilQ
MKRSTSSLGNLARAAMGLLLVALSATAVTADAGGGANQIREVKIRQEGGQTIVTVVGSAKPTFTAFKLSSPQRLVVDLANSRIKGVPSVQTAGTPLVDAVAVSEFSSGGVPISRVIVAFKIEAAYRVKIAGTNLMISLRGGPQAAEEPAIAGVDPAMLEAARAEADAAERKWSAAKAEIDEAERRLAAMQADAVTARSQLDAAKAELAELKAKGEAEAGSAQKATLEAKAARAQLDAAKIDLERIKTAGTSALEKSERRAEQQIATLRTEIAAAEKRIAEERSVREALELHIASLEEQRDKAKIAAERAEQARAAATAAQSSAKADVVAHLAAASAAKAEAAAAVAAQREAQIAYERAAATERAALEAQLARREREAVDAKRRVADLETARRKLDQVLGTAQGASRAAETEAARALAEQRRVEQRLTAEVARADAQRAKAEKDASIAAAKAAAAIAQKVAAERDMQEMRELAVTEAERSKAAASQAVAAAQARIEKAETARRDAEANRSEIQQKLAAAEQTLARSKIGAAQAEVALEEAKATIAVQEKRIVSQEKRIAELEDTASALTRRSASAVAEARAAEEAAKAAAANAEAKARAAERAAMAATEAAMMRSSASEKAAKAATADAAAKARAAEEAAKHVAANAEAKARAAEEAAKEAQEAAKAATASASAKARAAEEAAKKMTADAETMAKTAVKAAEIAAANAEAKAAAAEDAAKVATAAATAKARAAEEAAKAATASATAKARAAEDAARLMAANAEARAKAAVEAAKIAAVEAVAKAAAAEQAAKIAAAETRTIAPAAVKGRATQEEQRLARLAEMRGKKVQVQAQSVDEALPPEITDIRFVDEDGVQKVIIETNGAIAYDKVKDDGRKSTLVLRNAALPALLERTLDAGDFGGVVRTVSSYEEGDAVRVDVELEKAVRSSVAMSGDAIEWTFTKPAAVAESPARAPLGTTTKTVNREDEATYAYPLERTAAYGVTLPKISDKKKRFTGRHIDLDFKDADIHNILRLLSDVGQVNIVTADDVGGTVTIRMRDVPWDQALDVILQAKHLGMVRDGNLIRVAPLATLEKEREMEIARRRQNKELEPLETRLIPISYAQASEIQPRAADMLSERGKLSVDERTNVLVARDTAGNLDQIEALVRNLDTQTPQVLIEGRIVEASSTYAREIGIQWGGDFSASSATGNPTGLAFPSTVGVAGGATDNEAPTMGLSPISGARPNPNFAVNLPAAAGTGSGGALGITLGSIANNANLNLRLSALEEEGTLRILSSPKILTLDNREAHIEQGTLIPYSRVSAQGIQTAFKEAKLNLTVTPHVTADGSVLLKLMMTRDEPDFNNKGARGDPTILKREAQTELLVSDGHTAVIGGIFTRNSGTSYKKVPFFGDIPILGWLFKNRSDSDRRSEMLIFITPRIVNRAESIGN